MNKHGYVKKLETEYAVVDVNRTPGCGSSCSCNDECSTNHLEVKVRNTLHAQEGDLVELVMEPVRVTESIFLVYTLPLIMFFIGIGLARPLFGMVGMSWSQSVSLLAGFALMFLTYGGLKFYMAYTGASERLELKMKKIVFKL